MSYTVIKATSIKTTIKNNQASSPMAVHALCAIDRNSKKYQDTQKHHNNLGVNLYNVKHSNKHIYLRQSNVSRIAHGLVPKNSEAAGVFTLHLCNWFTKLVKTRLA